ncbi:hypothetical protein DY000_02057150 [Brassica cretica]|uniref:Uncharacterized protein n=1 Tax=Brassica cretica TaxID=69181 RepID=A0ABQ7AJX1_BRACR|nr:hypothetical protein DY000_02057150 [Brassica cretica]
MERTSIPSQRISDFILRPREVADLEVRKTHLKNLNDLQSNVVACSSLLILAPPIPNVVLSHASLSSAYPLTGSFLYYPSRSIQFR